MNCKKFSYKSWFDTIPVSWNFAIKKSPFRFLDSEKTKETISTEMY